MALAEREITTYQDYSPERKAEVLALIEAAGGNIQQVARDIGIPHQTIRFWVANKDRYSHFQNEKRAQLAEKLENTSHFLIDAVTPEKIGAASLAQIATAAGIFIDKMQLLRGQPTSINLDLDGADLGDLVLAALKSSGLVKDAIDVTPAKVSPGE